MIRTWQHDVLGHTTIAAHVWHSRRMVRLEKPLEARGVVRASSSTYVQTLVQTVVAMGTGRTFSPSGYMATCAHVRRRGPQMRECRLPTCICDVPDVSVGGCQTFCTRSIILRYRHQRAIRMHRARVCARDPRVTPDAVALRRLAPLLAPLRVAAGEDHDGDAVVHAPAPRRAAASASLPVSAAPARRGADATQAACRHVLACRRCIGVLAQAVA